MSQMCRGDTATDKQ